MVSTTGKVVGIIAIVCLFLIAIAIIASVLIPAAILISLQNEING